MSQLNYVRQKTALLFLVLALVNTAFSQPTAGTTSQGDSLRLFIIGNSFTRNTSTYLPQLSQEGGHKLAIRRAEIGGSSMKVHWDAVVAAEQNPDDPKGKPYGGKSLKMLLSEGKWHIVTFQQASIQSGDVSTYEPYARNLFEFIKKLQPQAQVVIHQTWAYRTDSKDFSRIAPGDSAKNAKQMWEKLRQAYHTTADELGLPVIPVGDAFWRIASSPKWGYHTDSRFDFAHAQPPALPDQTHSLNVGYYWNNTHKLALDAHHASAAGCYLGGLVWYSFLFNESPEKLRFKPSEVDEAFAEQLRKAAWKTVKKERKKSSHTWDVMKRNAYVSADH